MNGTNTVGALVVLALSAAGCEGAPRVAANAGEAGLAPPRITFEPVVASDSVVVGVVPASVIVPAEHRAALGPPLEGRIIAWRVGVGDAIAPGTPLIDLEVVGVADLEAALTEAKDLLAARSRTLNLERQAAKEGLSSASEVLAYEVAVAEAKARRDALMGQIEAKKKAVGGESGWTWTSSISGVIERIECPRGQLARPDSACLTVVDTSRAVVRVEVPERWLSRWSGPMSGELTLIGEDAPISLAEVRRAPRLDELSRTLAVDLGPTASKAPLTPGRSGRVALRAAMRGLAVPTIALTRLDGREVVFAKTAKGTTPIAVERLGRDGERIVVRLLGDSAMPAEVATRGLFLLKSQHILESEGAESAEPKPGDKPAGGQQGGGETP